MEGAVKQSLARIRALLIAGEKKYDVLSDSKRGSDRIIDIAVPVEDIGMI
jgi:hypothetical protein